MKEEIKQYDDEEIKYSVVNTAIEQNVEEEVREEIREEKYMVKEVRMKFSEDNTVVDVEERIVEKKRRRESMEKAINLKICDFKNDIIKIINDSKLPIIIARQAVSEIHSELLNIEKYTLEKEEQE